MFIIWLSLFLVVSVIFLLSLVINKKVLTDREKSSPFECGFDPQNSSRVPFSIRFFVVTLIFLIFDVEISLLLPFVFLCPSTPAAYLVAFFSSILLLGVFYEWSEGALSWID